MAIFNPYWGGGDLGASFPWNHAGLPRGEQEMFGPEDEAAKGPPRHPAGPAPCLAAETAHWYHRMSVTEAAGIRGRELGSSATMKSLSGGCRGYP